MRRLSIAFATFALISTGYHAHLAAQDRDPARDQSKRSTAESQTGTYDQGQQGTAQQGASQQRAQAGSDSKQRDRWSESWKQWWSDWLSDNEGSSGNAQERSRSGVREFIRRHDSNEDGKLSRRELPLRMRGDFDRLDTNKDGSVTQDEIAQHAQAGATARRARRAGSGPVEVTYVWVLDTDQGEVELDELQGAYEVLRKIDKNNDGKISRDELRARREQVASQWCDKCFDRMDQNEDGELSKSEAADSEFASDFDKIDKNHDQQLTKSEIHRYLDEQFQASDTQNESRQAQKSSTDESSSDEQSASRSNESTSESNRRR